VVELVREIISKVINGLLDRFDALLDRFDAFRYRRAQSRFYRAGEGIAFALAAAAVLGVGVLAATAIGRSADETPSVAQLNASRVQSSSRTQVVTETVKHEGRTVRLVRTVRLTGQRPGATVQDVITLPARTVHETHTVTTQEVATVTVTQAVTVTVFETVTCKPRDC
jgi:hypothetical protein